MAVKTREKKKKTRKEAKACFENYVYAQHAFSLMRRNEGVQSLTSIRHAREQNSRTQRPTSHPPGVITIFLEQIAAYEKIYRIKQTVNDKAEK